MIGIFAIVEMNGCILNLAIKIRRSSQNIVVRKIHVANASNACTGAIAEKSKCDQTHYINTVMHNDRCCNYTHTNHTSYRKVRMSEESVLQHQAPRTYAAMPAVKCSEYWLLAAEHFSPSV